MKIILLVIALVSVLFSHKLILNLENNEDGTIQVIGAFDTGQSAAGALIQVESLLTGSLLFEKRLPDESEIELKIPLEPYMVIIAGGNGHRVQKKGIAPLEGFTKKLKTKIITKKKIFKNTNTLAILWSICIILLSLILYFWIINTQRIILLLKNRN